VTTSINCVWLKANVIQWDEHETEHQKIFITLPQQYCRVVTITQCYTAMHIKPTHKMHTKPTQQFTELKNCTTLNSAQAKVNAWACDIGVFFYACWRPCLSRWPCYNQAKQSTTTAYHCLLAVIHLLTARNPTSACYALERLSGQLCSGLITLEFIMRHALLDAVGGLHTINKVFVEQDREFALISLRRRSNSGFWTFHAEQ